MSIKKGLKLSRKILLAICLPVLAVVIIAAAVVGAVLGTEGNKRLTAGNLADSTTSVSSTTINLGSTKIDANSKSAVQELINYVSGSSSNVSYTTLNTNMESWKGVGSLSSTTTKTKVANQFTTKTVTLGGIVWNVMYVSKADYTANGTTAGDIIVTLWQSSVNTSYTSKYSSTAVNSPDDTYPSNMYGASYIRSTLVGSTYSTNRTSLNATGVQNSHWKPFTTTSSSTVNGYAEVLATPANMKWQETEDPKITMGFANHYPNDAWGKVSTGGSYATWSSNSNGSMNYYDNASTTYPSWRNDKIWLPSMTETGWGATNTNRYGVAGSGIWNATADMRKTGSTGTLTQYAWLRSGAYSGAGSAMVLKNDGTSGRTDYNLTKEYAVRPAIHLNLKAAAKASGLLTQSITYHTSYGTAPANGTYTIGSTTNLSAPTNIPTGLTFNGWVKGSYAGTTKVTSLSGQTEALDLYATFNLTAATVTTTPSNKAASITSDASTTLSATFSHPYITNKEATVSTYWRYNDGTANLATATGMTVTNGATPSVAFSNPARTRSGKYTLYYALTPTTAAANKGLKALATQKAADFTLTVTEPIKYFTSYGTAPAKGSYTPGSSSLPALGSVTNIPAGYAFRGWAKGSYSGAVITTLSGQTTALDLYATFTPTAGTITTTPANKAVTITYGAGAAMSAEITHSLVTSGDATVTTYWRKSGENTDIATGNGITVVNGEHPSLTFAKPTRSMAGTYVLYYSLTTTAAAKAKGLFDRAAGEAARYTLTINKADLSVSTLPTITPPTGSDKLYIGQSISATKLTGGVVHCASANDNNVAGTWAITTTGVYTSYGKITAKFTPTDTENLNTLTGVEITTNAIQLYLRVQEDVSGIFDRVLTPKPAANIAVDYGSSIGFSISDDKFTFMVRQNGTVNNVDYAINEHSGFTSFMHLAADTEKEELTANSPELTNVTTDKLFTIAYIGADTAYTVYYLLDGTDSGYPEGSTAADFNALISGGSQYVYKSELTGATGRRVKYMSNGKPLNASLAARADIDQRVLDEEKTGEIKVVSSDGSTVQIIYLKLKTYTLTYAASGASPSLQTKVCKYGAVINNAGISVPQKDMNEFKGWFYDAGFENAVAVGTDKVVADTQLYAKFETKHYKLIFDFNIGSESNQLPDDENRTVAVNSYNLFDHVISWDVDRLFAESFGFTQSDGTGRYEIDYTVNNLSANKSITGIKPSAIGYTFGGWYTEGTNTQTNVIRRPNANTDDVIVLVAKWTPAMFTMRFDKQDGSRITTKSVRNMAAWDEILPAEPSRTGYIFEGWYITTDEESEHFNSVYEASTCQDNDGNWLFSISDFANSGFYGSVTAGFNFSSLTVYAVWQSVDVEIKKICAHGDLAFYRDGEELTSTDPVYIGDTISVEVDVDNGYEFRNLIVGGRALTNGITTFTVAERNVMSGVDDIGEGYNYITVEAVFVEERYTIEYDTDGGKAADSTFARTYTASNIGADSINRAKLPSLLTKRGYDFAGWIFATTEIYETPDPAFETDCDLENLYGADLWLKKPFDNIYRDVTLKAVWTPQRAEVYLYNATYSGVYNKDTVDTSRYAIHDFGGDDIVTGMDIDITNPSRGESFVFLGWATTRNGAVVYPAEEGTTVISYRVNPHKDEKGNLLNQNNLYAVWHVAGIDYVVMSATNNNCTYGVRTADGKEGITMSAKPARNYESDTSAEITLNYKWYKIYEGRYDDCFEIRDYEDKDGYKWYVDDSGNIAAYYKDGKYYAEDRTTVISKEEAEALGTKLTYKEFNPLSVNDACVLKAEQTNKKPSDAISYNVKNVNDCGTYICVVEVVAKEQEGGSTTKAGGYGEIEITMNKAVYNGLSLAKKKVTYNSTPRGDEITVTGLPVTVENGLRTVTLPDGSKVNVNYSYFALAEDGVTRTEIYDVNEIKNVGKYVVVASFSFAVGGDKGNYEPLEELEAELTISADTLSLLEFGFMHGGDKNTQIFSGAYDGTPYWVEVAIKDTLSINSGSVLVTTADDVYVIVKVYRITENGDEEVTGDTIGAGNYAVVIDGLGGEAAGNYILAGGLNLRKEYTITKRVYDVAGHINFSDKEVVFDHELHALSINLDAGFEMPSTVTVSYSVEYTAEEEDFTEGRLSNETKDNNGGRYAGMYTVTVTFTDSASDNYEELESKTATLTVKKAKFFEFYNKDGADLLRDGGFVNRSYSYVVNKKYNPRITGTLLSDSEHFSITYEYYRVSEMQRDRTMLGSGTYEELEAAGNLISLAGKYEIVALIRYESALYRNNFEEIDESESTITYVIRNVNVESVEVAEWAEGFNLEAKLGTAFDYSWIKQINVTYAENAGTLEVKDTDIALAGITLEKRNGEDQTTFWHTGVFNVKVSFYGTESEAYEFAVKEEVQEVELRYGAGAGTKVPAEGLELLTDGTAYRLFIEYDCTDENGNIVTRTTEVSVAAGGFVLGKNVLTVHEDYYTFTEEVSVNIYKVIENVTWEYSTDGTTWSIIPDSHELVYAGTEYLIRVRFEDGETQYCEAYTDSGLAVLNANANGYLMLVGRSGNYKVTAEYLVTVIPKVLEFTWDTTELEYNTWHRSPKVATSGLEAADEGLITFGYEYYADGVSVTTDKVVGAGEYEVAVVLRGDLGVRNNYTLEGSTTARHAFEIIKADIAMNAVYSESNYGENITFAGNPQGLRRSALKADFGTNAAVAGEFAFITNYDEAEGTYDLVEDEKELAPLIASQGYAEVWYVYVPEDKNYNDRIGSITLNVNEQTAKSGAGALCVELGKDAVPFYLINQVFDIHGIEVYKLYESAYLERGTWYGLRTAVENPKFRIGTMAADGYKISAVDLNNEKVVLRALSGNDNGTLDIPVVEKTASGLQVSSTGHRTVYYVGETPDFGDLEFRVLFGEGETPQEGLKVGAVKTTFNETITKDGTFTVVFTYFNVECEVTFTARNKDDLQIVRPVNTVLTYKGEKLDAPEIGFTVDGVKYGQNGLDGVNVTVAVYRDGRLADLIEEGEYTVRYSFEISSPRFNKPANVEVPVTVTKNPYKVDITVSDGESAAYTGNPISIPVPVVGAVTDSTDGDAELPANRVSKVYTVNGKEVDVNKSGDWLYVNRGTYEVEITVKVLQAGSEPYLVKTVTYTFTITQAENDASKASVDAKNVVLGEGANFNFKVTADFGASTAILEYSTSRNGTYTTDKPTTAGTYYVRAKIAETNNYKGLTSEAVLFEVRNPGMDAGENGSISGENGVGSDWSLEISEMNSDDVSKESISKQNVLTGYEVVLKNGNGVAVSGEGEYTVKVKLSEKLSGKTDLKIFFKNADGKTVEKNAKVKDGYIEFRTSEFGTFIVTTTVPGEPVGLLVAVIVLGVVAAAGITACIIVFVKKKKKGAEQ